MIVYNTIKGNYIQLYILFLTIKSYHIYKIDTTSLSIVFYSFCLFLIIYAGLIYLSKAIINTSRGSLRGSVPSVQPILQTVSYALFIRPMIFYRLQISIILALIYIRKFLERFLASFESVLSIFLPQLVALIYIADILSIVIWLWLYMLTFSFIKYIQIISTKVIYSLIFRLTIYLVESSFYKAIDIYTYYSLKSI